MGKGEQLLRKHALPTFTTLLPLILKAEQYLRHYVNTEEHHCAKYPLLLLVVVVVVVIVVVVVAVSLLLLILLLL